ncbi:sensor domain-containing diguanylate cyclase [Vibrio sp. SCSIO 43137]|uniref:sensor domain-containing diguanylate cyclase n=1 Tax=Vibrio sp. SCSIO 43137 TaxID=3021011 RepID=UPI0023073127|nr:sensor domain-containing diguanylate cyclase [Vibrio sp. SCSIO 43137]WCE30563.1 sensor domain-containing diguanylate cyclase [Vibrio sp. SCSIO 43137]
MDSQKQDFLPSSGFESDLISVDIDKWQRTVNLMSELYGAACGTIVQYKNEQFNVITASMNEDNFLAAGSTWPWDMQSFCREIMETGKELYVGDAENSEKWKGSPGVAEGPVRSYLGFPILWPDGHLFGTICVIDTKATDYEPKLIRLLNSLCELITADLKIAVDLEQMKSLALTDELTQLHNRRSLELLGEQKLKEIQRDKTCLSVIYIDIDNMKQVNDQFGHSEGDNCLVTLAEVLRQQCRTSDIVARIGGDEFVVLTLSTTPAYSLMTRIKNNYSSKVSDKQALSITSLSCGLIVLEYSNMTTLKQAVEQADERMYEEKQKKKNA